MNYSISNTSIDADTFIKPKYPKSSRNSSNLSLNTIKLSYKNTSERSMNEEDIDSSKELKSALDEIYNLQNHLIKLEADYFSTKEDNSKLQKDITLYKERIENLKNNIHTNNAVHLHETSIITNAADNDIEELHRNSKILENENNKYIKRIREMENTIQDYNETKQKISHQNDLIIKNQNYIKTYELKVIRLEAEINQLKNDYNNERNKNYTSMNNSNEIAKLKKIIEIKDKECEEYKIEFKKIKKEAHDLSNLLCKKDKEIDKLINQHEDAVEAIKKLSTDFIILKNKETELNEVINNLKKSTNYKKSKKSTKWDAKFTRGFDNIL